MIVATQPSRANTGEAMSVTSAEKLNSCEAMSVTSAEKSNPCEAMSVTSVENISMIEATQPSRANIGEAMSVTSVEDVSMVESSQPTQTLSKPSTIGRNKTNVNSVTMDQTKAVDSEIITNMSDISTLTSNNQPETSDKIVEKEEVKEHVLEE